MEIKNIPVARLMTQDLVTVSPETSLVEAGEVLLDRDIGSVVVVDSSGKLVGILTSTDFVNIVTNDLATADATVAEFMTESVVTVGAEATIRDAAATMIADDIEHLPVEKQDGSVAGMLSTTDLTAHLAYLES
ncbi:signal transduction protein [Halobacteriales archaeon QS_6_64_34]|nr:MAG: signal transduction protein [Halobacteriales archaeon QS_6_64_34]